MTQAIYNEVDPYAAQWLENLIAEDWITEGDVDDRSIVDLKAADVEGEGQRHFFAGIGVWSYALRLAGWPDEVDVWTGSCPCQPFSTAGRGEGAGDARHLWPAWYPLIEKCRPVCIFGEQVASADGRLWLDAVSADLEALDYTVGAIDTCSASVGAPHIRQRLYWVALTDGERLEGLRLQLQSRQPRQASAEAPWRSTPRRLAFTESAGQERREDTNAASRDATATTQAHERRAGGLRESAGQGDARGVGDASSSRGGRNAVAVSRPKDAGGPAWFRARRFPDELVPAGATSGAWADAEWWACRDGYGRPAEPGHFPLVARTTERMGRLSAYGNALTAPVAATFIEAVMLELAGGSR